MGNSRRAGSAMPRYTFNGDPVTYVVPTLIDLDEIGFRLARMARVSGIPLETTVVISNGALPYSTSVHNHLGNTGKIITIGMSYYDFDRVRQRAEVVQDLSDNVEGKAVFLLDEVVDRGGTMPVAIEHIRSSGAKSVHSGTLIYKRRSAYLPDFVGEAIEDEWVVFPHDIRPSVEQIAKKWRNLDVPESDIRSRLQQLFERSPHLMEQLDHYQTKTLV